jgi:dTMP kinase
MKRSGIFIAFEGIDLCGKTTQKEKFLGMLLQDRSLIVVSTKEPGSPLDNINQQIRQILLNKRNYEMDPRCELALFFADRAQHIKKYVLSYLEMRAIVLTDRQFASTFAYQGCGRRLFNRFSDFKKENDKFCYGVYPDLNIIIDVPVEVAQARARSEVEKSRFDVEDKDFHQRVRDGFLFLAGGKKINEDIPGDWLVFDGTKPIEELHKEIYQNFWEWLQIKRQGKG